MRMDADTDSPLNKKLWNRNKKQDAMTYLVRILFLVIKLKNLEIKQEEDKVQIRYNKLRKLNRG